MDLKIEIEHSTAHRPVRDKISGFVLEHTEHFKLLLDLGLDVSDKNHHKAWWTLELVLESDIGLIRRYLDEFTDSLNRFTDESALRSISKICLFMAMKQFRRGEKDDFATDEQLQKIASAAFDWLIDDRKVATKAYAMRTLFLLGKRYDWIYPDLKEVLSKDFPYHSAGYKAAARQLLLKLR